MAAAPRRIRSAPTTDPAAAGRDVFEEKRPGYTPRSPRLGAGQDRTGGDLVPLLRSGASQDHFHDKRHKAPEPQVDQDARLIPER